MQSTPFVPARRTPAARRPSPRPRLLPTMLCTCLLVACGSGSGGDPQPPPENPGTPDGGASPPPPPPASGGSAGDPSQEESASVAMYSYESSLAQAAPVDGAAIDAALVYFFVEPGEDWLSREVLRVDYYCCRGLEGPGAGEPHGPRLSVSYEPWSLAVDLSALPAGGRRELEVRAVFADGSLSEPRSFRFEVPPDVQPNAAPVIGGRPDTRIAAGREYRFVPSASDPDGDTISFSIANQPPWAAFDRATGRLSGTPSGSDVGEYRDITVSVSDGRTTTSLSPFSIRVDAYATGSVTLSWQPPTEREDGAPLLNLAGYRLYYGTSSRQYTEEIRIDNPGITSYVVENLSSGTWYFALTAFDEGGLESEYSEEAVRSVP